MAVSTAEAKDRRRTILRRGLRALSEVRKDRPKA